MAETRWKLTLESSKASRNAKALARDLRELAAAVKELKDAAGGLDLAGLGGARGRRSGGGSGGSGRVSDNVRRAREEARRARDEARTADRVRRSAERAQAQNARREAREAAARQRDGARAQRAQDRAGERRYRLGFADARQRARDFRAADRAAGRGARADERAAAARQRALRQEARERRESLSAGLGGAASTLGGIIAATTAAVAAITGIVAAVGSLVARLSEAVLEMIAFREASIATLGLMSEGRTAQERQRIGEEEFRWARQFARETPLDVRDVIGLRTQAATSGFRGNQARDVVMAAADVGAANPTSPMASQRFTTAIGQIRSKGRLQTEELNQLTEAGVARDEIFAQLARARNVTGTQQQVNNRIAEMIRRGQVTGEQGVAATLAAVRERSGGQLGGLARSGGSTLMGTLSNLRGAFADFVLGIERIEQLPGITKLKAMLNELVDVLTGTGPVAQRLQANFAGIVDRAATFLAGIGGKGGIAGIIGRAVDFFERWAPLAWDVVDAFASEAWSTLVSELSPMVEVFGVLGEDREGAVRFAREFGHSLAVLLAFGIRTTVALAAMVPILTMLVDKFLRLAEVLMSLPNLTGTTAAIAAGPLAPLVLGGGYLRERFFGVGSEIPEGMREGVEANRGGLLDAIASLNADVVATTQTDLDIHSPSRVFRDLGAMVPAGMAAGVDSGAADVQRAVSSMVAPPALGALGVPGGAGGFNATFNVYTQPGTPDEIGEQIAEATWSKLMGRFENAAAMQGG